MSARVQRVSKLDECRRTESRGLTRYSSLWGRLDANQRPTDYESVEPRGLHLRKRSSAQVTPILRGVPAFPWVS
jgi:hypothetical protein